MTFSARPPGLDWKGPSSIIWTRSVSDPDNFGYVSSTYAGGDSYGSSISEHIVKGRSGIYLKNAVAEFFSTYFGQLSVFVPTMTMPGGVDAGASFIASVSTQGAAAVAPASSNLFTVASVQYRAWVWESAIPGSRVIGQPVVIVFS